MLRLVYSHCRDIRVNVFTNKIVYDIPIYGEPLFKNPKVELNKHSILLTLYREPIIKDLENPLIESERTISKPSVSLLK